MMWWLFGVLAGVLIGTLIPVSLSADAAPYAATLLLVLTEAVLYARASRSQDSGSAGNFIRRLLIYSVAGCGIVFFGRRFDAALHLAVCAALSFRIFSHIDEYVVSERDLRLFLPDFHRRK